MRRERPAAAIVVLFLTLVPLTSAAQGFAKKAAELARLRGEAEKLESEIKNERVSGTAQLKTLIAQKGELSLLLQKQKVRIMALRRQRARQFARIQARSAKSSQLLPVLREVIGRVEKLIRSARYTGKTTYGKRESC